MPTTADEPGGAESTQIAAERIQQRLDEASALQMATAEFLDSHCGLLVVCWFADAKGSTHSAEGHNAAVSDKSKRTTNANHTAHPILT